MANFYGVRTSEQATGTGAAAAVTAGSGIAIAFGTAPVHQVDGGVNEIVVAESYEEAVSALGYSDDWEKYTLCEVIYSHFKLYGVSPLLLVNVLDPSSNKTSVAGSALAISSNKVEITGDAIASTIVVKNGSTNLVSGTDYDVFYSDGKCIIEALSGGAMDGLTTVTVSYDKVDDLDADDMKTAVIGGHNASTGVSTGLELLDYAVFKTGIIPDLIIAPGFSDDAEVAAVMAAKTTYSTVFKATAICDLPATSDECASYTEAVSFKNANHAYQSAHQIVCYPMVAYGDRIFHMSTQLAGVMATVDRANDNIPSRIASNHVMVADSVCLEDGTDVVLDLTAANYLRGKGIVTALNFINGFTAWGAYTAVAPDNTDPKDMFIGISRMFVFISNYIVTEYWKRIDENMTQRYAESIADELNVYLNSLVASGDLLGGRCEVRKEENPSEDLMAGIVHVHVYITPPTPAQEIDYVLEYDVEYVNSIIL